MSHLRALRDPPPRTDNEGRAVDCLSALGIFCVVLVGLKGIGSGGTYGGLRVCDWKDGGRAMDHKGIRRCARGEEQREQEGWPSILNASG